MRRRKSEKGKGEGEGGGEVSLKKLCECACVCVFCLLFFNLLWHLFSLDEQFLRHVVISVTLLQLRV